MDVIRNIQSTGKFTEDDQKSLDKAFDSFMKSFMPEDEMEMS